MGDIELLSLSEVLARTGLARRTFYRLRERNEFAPPVRISSNKRIVLWRSDDVDAWRKPRRVHRDP